MEYYLDPTSQYPFPQPTGHIGKNAIVSVLEHVFNPNGTHISAFKDCILISLDTEYESCTQQILEIGLATLDTREIKRADLNEPITDIISSRLLILGKRRYRGTYLFGSPEKHDANQVANFLRPCFEITDTKTMTLRNIILVGHGVRADIKILRSSGLDLLELPMIKAVIDTSSLLRTIYHVQGHTHSLRRICTYLGMYRRNMHNAGNDAMYTLKALLLMFHFYKDQKLSYELVDGSTDQTTLYECQLEAIKRIGRYNNGISRYKKKRQRKLLGNVSICGRSKSQHPDLLNLEIKEEAFLPNLFHSE